ncbi:MAG: lysine--tRNA ligase, partial [Methanolobus sp.]|nr:lysine--tRNA ligase [Methanolobus sp.]
GSDLHKMMATALGVDSEGMEVEPKDLFKAIYTSVLGQQSGPKAGWFLSSMEKDFLVKRFREAAEYRP